MKISRRRPVTDNQNPVSAGEGNNLHSENSENNNPTTVSELADQYGAQPLSNARLAANNARTALRKAGTSLGMDLLSLPISEWAQLIDEMETALMELPSPLGSRSAWRTSIRKLYSFSVDSGLAEISPASADELGYPIPTKDNCGSSRKAIAIVHTQLLGFVSTRRIAFARMTQKDIRQFVQIHQPLSPGHDDWRRFVRWWNVAVVEHQRPELRIDRPSLQPVSYKIALDDLPADLKQELEQAKQRRLSGGKGTSAARQPVRPSTAQLELEDILRLLGWIRGHGVLLDQHDSVSDVITEPLLRAYLDDRNAISQAKYTDADNGFGRTQQLFLTRMTSFAAHGLLNSELAERFRILRAHLDPVCYDRREPRKDAGTLDDYFRTAEKLLDEANDPRKEYTSGQRGFLIRDAVIFTILGSIPYRRTVCANLRLNTSIFRLEDHHGPYWRIRIPKEETKPGKRMLNHDLPRMFTQLLDFYTQTVRPAFAKKDHDYLLFNDRGGPMADGLLWQAFTAHTEDILGIVHNPHQVRKAWATAWLDYSQGDYITASALMDSTPRTIERSYEQRSTERAIRRMDEGLDDICNTDQTGNNQTIISTTRNEENQNAA